jgi:hypothetical protein
MRSSARFASVRHPAGAKFPLYSPGPIQQVLVLRDYMDRTGFVDAKDPRHLRLVPPELLWTARLRGSRTSLVGTE